MFDVTFAPLESHEGDRAADIVGIEPGRVVAVSGTATVPRYRVEPSVHDFGRVCVDEVVDVDLALIVEPSAEIAVSMPELLGDPAFVASFVAPTGYPAQLAPAGSATINVHAVAPDGAVSGQLVWRTDRAPGDQTAVDVALEGIRTGLAVTPLSLDFGQVMTGTTSGPRSITIRACGGEAFDVDVALDDRGGAFDASASRVGVTAAPTAITVTFAPWSAGDHVATLRLTPVGAETIIVDLIGTAVGDIATTNYYACGCDGNTAHATGIATALMLLAMTRRRRRAVAVNVTVRRTGSS
jgi:hypothetical protein